MAKSKVNKLETERIARENALRGETVTVNSAGEVEIPDAADLAGAGVDDDGGIAHVDVMAEYERDSVLEAVEGVIDENDSGAKIVAYRRDPQLKNGGEFLFEISPQEWNARGQWTLLQHRYGAGMYEVRVFGTKINADGESRRGMIARGVKRCAEPLNPPEQKPEVLAPAAGNEVMLNFMREMQAQNLQVLERIAGGMKQSGGMTEMILALKALDDLRGPKPVATPPADPMESFTKMIDLQNKLRELSPSSEGGSDALALLGIIREFAPLIKAGLENSPAKMSTAAAPLLNALPDNVTPLHQPAQEQIQQPQQNIQDDDEMLMQILIKKKIAELVNAARNNDPVDAWAQKVIDSLPDEALDALMENAGLIEYLASFNPEVKSFAPWFEKLRAKIDELTKE